MADIVDNAEERTTPFHLANIAEVRRKAAMIPKGTPGDCELCGEWSGRLIKGVCAPCRDKHKLP